MVPLTMAGEAGAPLAAMVGSAKRAPNLLVVAQPRNRDQRFAFAADLGRIVMDYIDSCRRDRRQIATRGGNRVPGTPTRRRSWCPTSAASKPWPIWAACAASARRTGPYPVPAVVPELGMWLTFLVDRAEQAGTSMLLPVTGHARRALGDRPEHAGGPEPRLA